MPNYYGPKIVTDGLILCLDAANPKSYPRTGTKWYDLSGRGAHGELVGGVSFTSSYINFSAASDGNYISSSLSQQYLDFTIAFEPDFSLVAASTLSGLIATSPNLGYSDKSLRFAGVNGTGPWVIGGGGNPGDQNDWSYVTATKYYVNGNVTNTLVSGWNIIGGFRTNTNPFPSSFVYHLGSSGYISRGFRGKIAAVYMYNRQLSATEQLENYNALKTRFGL
jgi:hypothetical protein